MASKILIVEDDPANLVYLTFILKRLGVNYETASSGPEALEKLDSITPDIFLLDISLTEEMSGVDLVKILNKNKELAEIPKIAMSAHITSESKDDYIKSGFSDCLKKPYTIEDLSSIINNYR